MKSCRPLWLFVATLNACRGTSSMERERLGDAAPQRLADAAVNDSAARTAASAGAAADGGGGTSAEAAGVAAEGGAGGNPKPADAGSTAGASGASEPADARAATTHLTSTPAWPSAAILTGVRDVATPPVTQVVQLRNEGSAPAMITALTITGADQHAFRIDSPTAPLALPVGVDMPITIEVMTTGSALPPAPPQNSGGTLLTAMLSVSAGADSAQTTLYGLLLTTATHEVTLGQILVSLGFNLNVGLAQNNANPNTGSVQELPTIEAGTDEIAAPLFRKNGAGSVSLRAVARFSRKGPMPFGWYAAGHPDAREQVATMASMPDTQTSDKARMVLPPNIGSTDFDPGDIRFGIWVYTNQASQKYDSGGSTIDGDYAFSEDAPNTPAGVHRTKVYPLKDAGSFLLAIEEAGNGDYQDYVFVLSNVSPAE